MTVNKFFFVTTTDQKGWKKIKLVRIGYDILFVLSFFKNIVMTDCLEEGQSKQNVKPSSTRFSSALLQIKLALVKRTFEGFWVRVIFYLHHSNYYFFSQLLTKVKKKSGKD